MSEEFIQCYAYKEPGSQRSISIKKQTNLFKKMGYVDFQIVTDEHNTIEERDAWIKTVFSRGGTLIIAFPQILGHGKRRNKLLRELAEIDTYVQIGDGQPVLYDSDDKIAAFAKFASQEAKVESGRILGTKHAKGRPVLYQFEERVFTVEEQEEIVRAAWHNDSRSGAGIAMKIASIMLRMTVPLHALKKRFGNRHKD